MRSRLRSHDGANAVEFALILPILVTLLLGIFTGGMTLNRWLQMNHAGREGVRYAATLPVSTPDWFDEVLTRTYEAGAGELNLADDSVRLCASRQRDGSVVGYFVEGDDSFTPGSPKAWIAANKQSQTAFGGHCYGDGLPGGDDRVQVRAERDAQIQALFFALNPTLDARSVARFENQSS